MGRQYYKLGPAESKEFGCIVRKRRISLDWTVERLAIEVHRTERLIRYIERGSHYPCQRTIAQFNRIWPDLQNNLQENGTNA